jgi:hypothetical protein
MERMISKNKFKGIEEVEKRFTNFGLKFTTSAKLVMSFGG